jgi:hypothetical protein
VIAASVRERLGMYVRPSDTKRIGDIPVGSHTIEVWHERQGRRSADVTVRTGAPAEMVVEVSKMS